MHSELKPCPFCGGEAHVSGNMRRTDNWVICTECDVIYPAKTNREYTEAEAIKAWNTRAERTCNVSEGKDQRKGWWVCSECDTPFDMIGALAIMNKKKPMYCPGCGAKVIGG